jgi:hypothetical protein
MTLKIGNGHIISITVDKDISTATDIKFMIKTNSTDANNVALVSKSLADGIAVSGYVISVLIDSNDTESITPGNYYMACEVVFSGTNNQEINITENSIVTDRIKLTQDVIR